VTAIDRIIDELRRAHDGDPWHGSPVTKVLEGVTATQAAARPLAGAHTIWELVLHMTTWRDEVARRVQSGVAGDPDAPDWPPMPQPSDAAWDAALHALDESHAHLLRTVAALPPARLDDVLGDRRSPPEGTGVSYYVMLHGIAQHDAYHAGQIAMLKKAVSAA
jgi:uncharacterized damage-inducible protein DinB